MATTLSLCGAGFEKMTLHTKGLIVCVEVAGAISALQAATEYRTELIDEFRKMPPGNDAHRIKAYLSVPTANGISPKSKFKQAAERNEWESLPNGGGPI